MLYFWRGHKRGVCRAKGCDFFDVFAVYADVVAGWEFEDNDVFVKEFGAGKESAFECF